MSLAEAGEKIVDYLLSEQSNLIYEKAHVRLAAVWENRSELPVAYSDNSFDEQTAPLMRIPLVGGGYIGLGITNSSEQRIGLNVKFERASGKPMEEETIIFKSDQPGDPFSFSILDHTREQAEILKFLARLDPERDIDWEVIRVNSNEQAFALDLCRYKEMDELL